MHRPTASPLSLPPLHNLVAALPPLLSIRTYRVAKRRPDKSANLFLVQARNGFYLNKDTMRIYGLVYNGKLANGKRTLMSMQAANNISYTVHYGQENLHVFNGIKTRLTNGLAADGGILPA